MDIYLVGREAKIAGDPEGQEMLMTAEQPSNEAGRREALILFITEWKTNFKEMDGVEHPQGLAHLDKVIAVVYIKYRFAEGGSLQQLFLVMNAKLMSGRVYLERKNKGEG
jgi:hypothetical protein